MFGDNGFSLHIFHPVHFFYTDAIPEQLKLHQTQEREVATMKVFRVWFSDLEIQKLSHPLYPRGISPRIGELLFSTPQLGSGYSIMVKPRRSFQCQRCPRSFARLEHLQRHDRSRLFHPEPHQCERLLTHDRYQGETIHLYQVPEVIYSTVSLL